MATVSGRGNIVNSLIDKLPVELHLPGYNYCGPGTRLEQRLARNDQGINPLDSACKQHDITYAIHKGLEERQRADKVLERAAWQRVKASDSKLGERAAALTVASTMKIKRKLGMGCKEAFRKAIVGPAKHAIKRLRKKIGKGCLTEGVRMALNAAKVAVKKAGGCRNVRTPRIIPLSTVGGLLPLIPIFAGLSAVGSLIGGAAGITKALREWKVAKSKLEEAQRHNKAMEEIKLKTGRGLYLKPYRQGLGLYLQSKNY